ncbi:hypothetical protein TH53_10340 [Pedobacter lusitanus]|uniref:Contig41, whole genome shotgun sequence n=1 Tax=Pedobacter lusitanus TaxID=1503925 RepID=A0A0D0GM29_9SPHI|nr:hypothetical protein [Pedobacter lusitanus]KIO77240.1 hypothetical protein TH53_10340 [Pedobacter lusitanus]
MNFDKSEEYRKYVIGLQFKETDLYTVWGTDMVDGENDKFLVNETKLMVFESLDLLESFLKTLDHPFKDKRNFKRWVNEESLKRVYNFNNMSLLADFNLNLLNDKKSSLDILHSINLIRDFFIQINDSQIDIACENPSIINLKDFIYDNYFREKKNEGITIDELNFVNVSISLREMYDRFCNKLEVLKNEMLQAI